MIRRLAGSPLLRLFGTAVIDQAMLSAANFGVGILLLRYAPEHEYGYYVLAFSALQLMSSAQGAWITGPLSVLASKRSDERRREMVGAIERSQSRFLQRCAALLPPLPMALAATGLVPLHDALIASATVIAGWLMLRRELMRSVLLIYSRPQDVFRLDQVYAGALIGLAALAAVLAPAAGACAVLGLGLAAALGALHGRRAFDRRIGWVEVPAAPIWAELRPLGKWAASAAVIYWVYSQSYNYVVAARLDLDAVAYINAARLMMMPMVLLTMGVGQLLVPNASGWLHREGLPSLMRRLWQFFAGLLVLDGIYVGVIWLLHNWVAAVVMDTVIPQLDLLVVLWAVHLTLSMTRDVFLAGALALECHRPLAWFTALAALVSLSGAWMMVGRFGPPGAIMGTIAGEVVSLAGVGLVIAHRARRLRMAAPT